MSQMCNTFKIMGRVKGYENSGLKILSSFLRNFSFELVFHGVLQQPQLFPVNQEWDRQCPNSLEEIFQWLLPGTTPICSEARGPQEKERKRLYKNEGERMTQVVFLQ